ncbi:MAG: hypothetical protein J6V88_04960 [Kiritimatiellae bacterium]|nr:hypothetical protein [Kiritimatiellia bacterium]
MNIKIQPLIDLQEVDGRIRELEREAKDLPMRKAQETASLRGDNAALSIAKEHRAAVEKKIEGMEREIEERKNKILEIRTSLPTIKSNKELLQVNIQLETLERENSEAEFRMLAQADEIPTLDAEVVKCQARVDAAQGKVDELVAELDERIAQVNEELESLKQERVEKSAAITNPRLKLYYERIRTKRWPAVVTLNSDNVCDGCHLRQPPSVGQMVDKEKDPSVSIDYVCCTMCGRILYRD